MDAAGFRAYLVCISREELSHICEELSLGEEVTLPGAVFITAPGNPFVRDILREAAMEIIRER